MRLCYAGRFAPLQAPPAVGLPFAARNQEEEQKTPQPRWFHVTRPAAFPIILIPPSAQEAALRRRRTGRA